MEEDRRNKEAHDHAPPESHSSRQAVSGFAVCRGVTSCTQTAGSAETLLSPGAPILGATSVEAMRLADVTLCHST